MASGKRMSNEPPATEPLVELPADHVRMKRCRYGPMLYLKNDLFVGRSLDCYGEYSEGEMELLRQIIQPGQLVLDVGANIGTHTVAFAKLTGPNGAVLAFEPQRLLFQVLCANVALNGLAHVFTHHAAVGRRSGRVLVPTLDVTAEQNFGALSLDGWKTGEKVRLMTIDELELPACDLVKIDVEGMEGDVIAGGESTICRFQPILYVEYEHGRPAELIQQLFDLGYRLYWHVIPMFNPDNFFRNPENVFGNVSSFSMVGLHQSVPQVVDGLTEITSPNQTWQPR
jgi:FkbM family methyltransferase